MFTRQSCLRSKAIDLCRTAAQTGVSAAKSEMTHTDRTILPAKHTCSSEMPMQLMSIIKAVFIVKMLHLPLLGADVDRVQIYSRHQPIWNTLLQHLQLHYTRFFSSELWCAGLNTQNVLLCLDLFTHSYRAWKLMSVFVLFVPGTGHCYLQLHSLAMPPAILTCTHNLQNPCPGSSCCHGTTVQVIQKYTSIFIILLWLLCERAWKGIHSPETKLYELFWCKFIF